MSAELDLTIGSSSDADTLSHWSPGSDSGCQSDFSEEEPVLANAFPEAFEEFSSSQKSLLESRERFVSAFAHFTHSKVSAGDCIFSQTRGLNRQPSVFFRSRRAPICIKEYVDRIATHSKCSTVCFASAFVYLQRLSQVGEQYRICPGSVHRLLIAGVLIAAKLMDDKFYSNAFYARIGGVSVKEMNRLELEMLKLMGFKAFVSYAELSGVLDQILSCSVPECIPPPSEGAAKPGKRRAHEEAETDPGCSLPAKLLHDSHRDQVHAGEYPKTAGPCMSQPSMEQSMRPRFQVREENMPQEPCSIHVMPGICAGGQ